ncbi:HAD-like domain-containing protein [Multifurca ochricompacta]|uniref:HAD-like domain-containing protein n=1 Tax=Multifurca ochricompacta TaxID=376703 RepID=A0AAD4LSI1_9AGAM|nr:HAD-like domain-containing protein [Multifurca ochricompacta]
MTDFLGYGKEKRRAGNLEILSRRVTFRDAFREMLESVSQNGHTFEECKQFLKDNIKLDPGFKDFIQYCKSQDIPVIIVSSGMEPLIRTILTKLVGDDANDIDIISNSVEVHKDGSWNIKYRHPSSGYGHDKSQAILPYKNLAEPPLLFFFGDGVSDMSAAKYADVLFVKDKLDGENDLAAYCTREKIPHVLFEEFSQALPAVRSIVEGTKTPKEWFDIGRV